MKKQLTNPEKWVDLHGSYLFRFALSRLRNSELAENLVQETFLAALQGKNSFSGRSSERTWLIGILKHKIYDHLRRKYREVPITDVKQEEQTIDSFYDNAGVPNEKPTDWMPNPRELLKSNEFWETFENCLKKLPQRAADAFSLREIDDLDTKQICKLLRLTPTNLWVVLHRARLQLRRCLETNWFEK
jgi:RNA polymerase sigma-70 factor, ECF subfamily